MTAIVAVVALQLVLLTLFVLYVLVARTANASQLEVAFAKLRGARLFPLVMVGLGEPLAVLTVALPLGLIVALFATELASRAMLENAPLTFPPLAPLAALAAYGGGLAATLAGGRRILTRRLLDELRAVETLPSPSARAAWDGAGLALAIAGMVELVTLGVLNSGSPQSLGHFGARLSGSRHGNRRRPTDTDSIPGAAADTTLAACRYSPRDSSSRPSSYRDDPGFGRSHSSRARLF